MIEPDIGKVLGEIWLEAPICWAVPEWLGNFTHELRTARTLSVFSRVIRRS